MIDNLHQDFIFSYKLLLLLIEVVTMGAMSITAAFSYMLGMSFSDSRRR